MSWFGSNNQIQEIADRLQARHDEIVNQPMGARILVTDSPIKWTCIAIGEHIKRKHKINAKKYGRI